MRYTKLGNSDLSVSRICLGCMGFGDAGNGQHSWTVDEEHSCEIIRRAAELADGHGVTMTEVSLAWLLTKVTAPVVGAAKLRRIEGAAKAVDLVLTAEELNYLEEPYVPHARGRNGTEHRLCRPKAPCLDCRQSENPIITGGTLYEQEISRILFGQRHHRSSCQNAV